MKKEAKAIIDDYDAILKNAEENIMRFGALGDEKRQNAAIERYKTVLMNNTATIEDMKAQMNILNSISRRSVQNRLKLMNDSELRDVIGIESYNTLDDTEKIAVTNLLFDVKRIKGLIEEDNLNEVTTVE